MIILMDDEDRENEGDLVVSAELIRPDHINFMATHARGLICLALEASQVQRLGLPLMPERNRLNGKSTAFTVSIEARQGVTTGISAFDRAKTIQTAINPKSSSDDLVTPGHVFPLQASPGGTLVRAGHTEGSVDLMRLSGLLPGAVICEIMKPDGTMARRDDLIEFSKTHGDLPILTIRDLIAYRIQKESLVHRVAESELPTRYGAFKVIAFKNKIDQAEHLALMCQRDQSATPLVRVHSECLTGDSLGSLRCDCGEQLSLALENIQARGNGVLVYMKNHEGRGIGLANKIKAYELQDHGMDTVEANESLGFPADSRQYGISAQILSELEIKKFDLLTNNPRKLSGLNGFGLTVLKKIPIEAKPNLHSRKYLITKREKLQHQLNLVEERNENSHHHQPLQ